jgi:hypothetical protein
MNDIVCCFLSLSLHRGMDKAHSLGHTSMYATLFSLTHTQPDWE